jgi:plastocyanin
LRRRTAALLTVPLLLAGCGGDDDVGDEAEPPTDEAADPEGTADTEESAGAEVAIVDEDGRSFEPADVTVAAGETVTWSHEGGLPHTVTAEDGAFDSGDLSGGDTFSHTFEEAGSFPYVCSIHPDMTGTVEVS